jgi:putative transposase
MAPAREWFSASDLAALALPDMPATHRLVAERMRTKGWCAAEHEGVLWRTREGRGGGIEFHFSALPLRAQAALLGKAAPDTERRDDARDERWDWYERLPAPKRARAEARLAALDAVLAMQRGGTGKVIAMQLVAGERGITLSTLYGWETRTHRVRRPDWLPHLADGWNGGGARAACPDEAWDMIRADYLRPEQPPFVACYRRLERVAAARGWTIPTARTLERRINAIPEATRTVARKGTEAMKRMYPAQERSRGHFHALQAVNADGHKWDVFVRWPDGEIVRPVMLTWQDLYSGKVLSWRVDKTENKEATRLSFGDLVEAFGIPDKTYLDNGRQFASKWITGRAPNRYRFKIRDEEPIGILTQMGVEIHWTEPYAGQSKPIERAFRDFATDTAKHPQFAGAYVGNNPLAKPENYGSAAVPLDTFLRVIGEEIAAHNARAGRKTAVCNGRSFDAAFAESYESAPIRRASPTQRRLWLLAAESLLSSRTDGSVTLAGNRFWAGFLTELRGTRVTVRFDPQAMQDDLAIYGPDGRFLGIAPCLEAVGFDDADAARAHARARKDWMRGVKLQADAERKMSIRDVAAMLPDSPEPAQPPERRVVRPVFGNTAMRARPEADADREAADDKFFDAIRRNAERLKVVRDDENP